MLVLGFDMTILNVALPTMAEQLGASTGQHQWIADAYVVVFAALMLPAGLLGDRFGRRRMLIAGLRVFLAGSLFGALVGSPTSSSPPAPSWAWARALVIPLALSVLPSMFGPGERAKAVAAVTAAMAALGMPLGPLVGGWLLDHYWWGSIFLINIPMVAIGVTACLFLLPESRDPASPKVDAAVHRLQRAGPRRAGLRASSRRPGTAGAAPSSSARSPRPRAARRPGRCASAAPHGPCST